MSENDETMISPQGDEPTESAPPELESSEEETYRSGVEEILDPDTTVAEPDAEDQLTDEPIPSMDTPPPVESPPAIDAENGGTNWVLIVVIVALLIICCCCLIVIGIALTFLSIGGSAAGDFYSNLMMALTPLLA